MAECNQSFAPEEFGAFSQKIWIQPIFSRIKLGLLYLKRQIMRKMYNKKWSPQAHSTRSEAACSSIANNSDHHPYLEIYFIFFSLIYFSFINLHILGADKQIIYSIL